MSDTGWVSPGTVADDDTVGTSSWSNMDNVKISDNFRADSNIASEGISHYLKCTNFGFSILAGAIIDGVRVTNERMSVADPTSTLKDYSVKLVKGGVVSGNNKANPDFLSADHVEETITYGGASDLWGLNLSVSDINASDFGVVISGQNVALGDWENYYIDHIQIKVYYTESGTPTVGVKYPLPAFKRS